MRMLKPILKIESALFLTNKKALIFNGILFTLLIIAACMALPFMIPLFMTTLLGPFVILHAQQTADAYRMYSILPISRRELVRARFLFISVLITFFAVILLVLMTLVLHFHLGMLGTEDGMNITEIFFGKNNESFHYFLFFFSYAFSMKAAGSILHKSFCESFAVSNTAAGKLKKLKQGAFGLVPFFFLYLVLAVMSGAASGISRAFSAVSTAFGIAVAMMMSLIDAKNGLLICCVCIVFAICSMGYQYICTVMDFEKREL